LSSLQVVSSTLAGAALGSLTGGGFADALGRRASFMLCALPMLVGPLLSATANSLNMMVAGRFLAGVAIGLSSALVPLYISEVGGCGPLLWWGSVGSGVGACAHLAAG
jgi:MFS family permease